MYSDEAINSMVAFFTSGLLSGSSCIFVDGLYRKSSGTETRIRHFIKLPRKRHNVVFLKIKIDFIEKINKENHSGHQKRKIFDDHYNDNRLQKDEKKI